MSETTQEVSSKGENLGENIHIQLPPVKLNDSNYLDWAAAIKTFISAKKKVGYINGKVKAPSTEDQKYEEWEYNDSIVRTWILSSVTDGQLKYIVRKSSAREMWLILEEMYSEKSNPVNLYDLEVAIHDTKQGTHSVCEYYRALRALWEEQDSFDIKDWDTVDDHKRYLKHIQDRRVLKFLHGLNSEYEGLRSQILNFEVIPSLEQCYKKVVTEERRRKTMLVDTGGATTGDHSALVSSKVSSAKKGEGTRKESYKGDKKCSHCGRQNHSVDFCWELHPEKKPLKFRKGQQSKGTAAATKATTHPTESNAEGSIQTATQGSFVGLSTSDVANLQKFLAQLNPSSVTTQPGISGAALSVASNPSGNSWIIDSGATDHMTGTPSLFSTYTLCSGQDKVTIADGTLATVAGKRNIPLTDHLTLSSALHVPKLSLNLLSVSSLTKSLNCSVTFFPSHCVFQDLRTGRLIGSGRETGGLYQLQSKTVAALQSSIAEDVISRQIKEIQLWHFRLGHLSFPAMKYLFPLLFQQVDIQSIKCQICHLAKHCRTQFPSSMNKSSAPFELVHSDVWGPASVPSIDGNRYFITFIDDFSHCTWVYPMKSREEVPTVVQVFGNMVEN